MQSRVARGRSLRGMTRRAFTVLIVVALVLGTGAVVASLIGGAASTTWYQCTNSAGASESTRGGTVRPTCAHAGDPILTWSAAPSATTTSTTVPSTTSTTNPATSTTSATTTTVRATTTTSAAPNVWRPSSASSISWDWQIGTVPTPHAGLGMVDIDGFDNSAADVTACPDCPATVYVSCAGCGPHVPLDSCPVRTAISAALLGEGETDG